jgi:hypothetical protein
MNQFVEACRKEWRRLGVPEGAANEMAVDLEADLAEAQADGVSPEAVLGNAYFDAASFAHSWATARGFVTANPRRPGMIQLPTRTFRLGAIALGWLVMAGVGFLVLVGRNVGSVAMAAVPFRKAHQVPGILIMPHRHFFPGPGTTLAWFGLILLVGGLVGLGVTIWVGRPWSTPRDKPSFDPSVGMHSYL